MKSKMSNTGEVPFAVFFIPLMLLLFSPLIIIGSACILSTTTTETTTYEVHTTDAPYGYYWIQGKGTPVLFSYRYDEKLTETYNIKYIIETEKGSSLETLLISSTSSEIDIILLDTNESMYFDIEEITKSSFLWSYQSGTTYTLFIPNPLIYGGR